LKDQVVQLLLEPRFSNDRFDRADVRAQDSLLAAGGVVQDARKPPLLRDLKQRFRACACSHGQGIATSVAGLLGFCAVAVASSCQVGMKWCRLRVPSAHFLKVATRAVVVRLDVRDMREARPRQLKGRRQDPMEDRNRPLGRSLSSENRQGRADGMAFHGERSDVLSGVLGHIHVVVHAFAVGVDFVKQRSEGIEDVEPAILDGRGNPLARDFGRWRQVAIEEKARIPAHEVDAHFGAGKDSRVGHSGFSTPGSESSSSVPSRWISMACILS
jgi:hypothetical protein